MGIFDPGMTKGDYTASIPAGPGSLKGWQGTVPHRYRLHLRKTSEVRSSCRSSPAKLEQLMLVNLVDLSAREAAYAKDWIVKNL